MQIHNSCICSLHFSRVGFKISPVLKMFVYLWHISQLDWIGFIIGYGVSTALRIVIRPTPFLTTTRLTNVQISNTWIRCRWFRCASIGSKCLIFGTFDNHHVQLTLTRALQIENRSAKRNQKTLCIEIRIFCKSVLIMENVSKVFAQQQTDPLHPL